MFPNTLSEYVEGVAVGSGLDSLCKMSIAAPTEIILVLFLINRVYTSKRMAPLPVPSQFPGSVLVSPDPLLDRALRDSALRHRVSVVHTGLLTQEQANRLNVITFSKGLESSDGDEDGSTVVRGLADRESVAAITCRGQSKLVENPLTARLVRAVPCADLGVLVHQRSAHIRV